MTQIVVISGHPELKSSYSNTVILDALASRFPDIDIRRLDSLYPDYQIDVVAEQQALLNADIIVLQFPFYWYSVPALLKKWLDDTFSYNFAYGSQGDKLKGKQLLLSFTVGGPEDSYTPTGYNHFRIESLLKPLEQTAYLAGLNFCEPLFSHRMVYIPGVYNSQDAVELRATQHAQRLIERLEHLSQSPEIRIQQFVTSWFSAMDELPENDDYFLSHLSPNITFNMPEGNFDGHQGFREWYRQARATFKPGCEHLVEQMESEADGDGYQVNLRVRLIADTFSESVFNGQSLNLLVNESWRVTLDEPGKVLIEDYQVMPVQELKSA